MRPTEILTQEHVLIQLQLENLTMALHKLEAGLKPPREFFEKAVIFAQSFVDRFHHYKEEQVMFARLAEKNHAVWDEPIAELQFQHERSLARVSEIEKALAGYDQDRDFETTTVLENLAAYISLLHRHIYLEDHVFLPRVERELSEKDRQELVRVFKKEVKDTGGHRFEESQKLVLDMRLLL